MDKHNYKAGDRVFWGKQTKYFGTVIEIEEDIVWVVQDMSSSGISIGMSKKKIKKLPWPFDNIKL